MNARTNFVPRLLASLLVLMLASCAYAPWQKSSVTGDTPDARVASARMQQMEQPEKMQPRVAYLATHEKAVRDLALEAAAAVDEAQYDKAEAIYKRILNLDPANPDATSGLLDLKQAQRHTVLVEEAQALYAKGSLEAARARLHPVLLENPRQAAALALDESIRSKQEAALRNAPPVLRPPFDKPVTLELRDANIKMVFEALTRTTGINFILDKDIKPDTKATVYIRKARVEDAIEMVLATNGLQKKVLSETNVLVFPNTQAKLKDYQDLMIRSFYLVNAKAKDVSALLKTMLKATDIHVDDRLNMLMLRDTPEVIRLAEKLVAANDMADPEVMLEMEVLEVNRSRLQELGINYPTQFSVTATTLQALRNIADNNINVTGNPALNFKKTSGDVNLLSNPRIRVRNNDKAKVHVGDKVPVITTTSTANVGVSESVQYVDVGLKLEVEPRVTLDDHVNIKVALEVASIARTITTTNGGLVYQIGTRNASTMLRLKDSETQVLAGLISDEERETGNKLPGLGDIPLLGRLFSTQKDEKNKTEILLAITPRILNNISRPQAEIQEYWSGTESGITDRPQIIAPGAGGGSGPQRALPVRPQIPARPNPPPETPSASPEGTPAPEATPAPPAENAANVESTPAATAPASP